MLTVACVYWQGNFRGRQNIYDVTWVRKLRDMVRRNLNIPHKFVCLSNVNVPHCDQLIKLKDDLPGYWSKVELFRPGLFEDRVLYLDLDVLVLKSLEPLINFDSKFAIMQACSKVIISKQEGKVRVKRYNSSVMVFDAGVADLLYTGFSQQKRLKFFGDQDWIGHMSTFNNDQDWIGYRMPQLDTFPKQWIKKLRDCPRLQPDEDMIIALCMAQCQLPEKNKSVVEKCKWAREIWI